MKERFKHNSEQEVNPITKPAVFTPNPGAARDLVVLSRWRRRFEPSLPAEDITGGKRHYPVFPLQHLHWSKSGVSEEGRAIICSPLPRGLFFRRDSEALLSAGRHISNSCFQLALLNSYTVVSGVHRKFEIPDILHMQDDDQEGKTPTETTTGQPQLAKEQRKLQQALYQC